MSTNPSRQAMGSLSVGNVVSASLRLYLDHLKPYVGVALRATLWSLLPFLILLPIPILLISGQEAALVIGLLVLIWIPLVLYCSAKYTSNSALISRLVFGQLVNKPESVRDAQRQLKPKFGKFFFTYLLYFLITLGVALVFYILMILLGFVGILIGASLQGNIGAIIAVVLVGLIIFGIALSFLIRLFTRLSIVEVPLAIEEGITAPDTIGRSWQLTKGLVGRIFLILAVAFLITLPIYIVTQIVASVIQSLILGDLQANPDSSNLQIGLQLLSFIVGYGIGLLSGVVILPFWQAVKAVIYYDLRTRREGLDLQIEDSEAF
jgi:hypothetical protein